MVYKRRRFRTRVIRGSALNQLGISISRDGSARHIIRSIIMYKRFWLNNKKGTAFCELEIEPDGPRYTNVYVKLADCNRQISLDFSFNKKTKKERLAKLDRFIASLQELRTEMEKIEIK